MDARNAFCPPTAPRVISCSTNLPTRSRAGRCRTMRAAARALMTPSFSGRFRIGHTPAHDCDNLIWEIQPDPSRRGVTIAFQHAGLGWLSLRLSRAQIEDLITGIEFALADMLRGETIEGDAGPADGGPFDQERNRS